MKALAGWVILTPLLLAGTAGGEVLEIPLSGLAGEYPDGQTVERIAEFDLGFAPTQVNGAWIRFTGTASTASLECDGGTTDTWRMEFYAMMPNDPDGAHWIAFEPTPVGDGVFAFAWPFASSPTLPGSWDFLDDGVGEVVLYGGPSPLTGLCGPATAPPAAVVDEAVLVIDLQGPISVVARTWGGVKALFAQ